MVVAALCLAALACQGEPHHSCSGQQPSYAGEVAPVLQGCSGGEICHGFGGAQMAYQLLVNVPSTRDGCDPGMLVAPGDVSGSYLVNKLDGVGMCPDTMRMPFGGPLPAAQIQTIVDWICSGAPNN